MSTPQGGDEMIIVGPKGEVMHNRCLIRRGAPCDQSNCNHRYNQCREATVEEIAAARLRGEI